MTLVEHVVIKALRPTKSDFAVFCNEPIEFVRRVEYEIKPVNTLLHCLLAQEQ